MDMGDTMAGCLGVVAAFLVVLVIVALAGGAIWNAIQESAADAAQARANEIRAQADLEQVRSNAWQERFMLWTSYLEHKSEDGQTLLVLVSAVAGALAARPITLWLARFLER